MENIVTGKKRKNKKKKARHGNMKEMNDCQKIEDIWKVGSYISEKKDEENIIPYKEKHYNYVRSPILLTEEKKTFYCISSICFMHAE